MTNWLCTQVAEKYGQGSFERSPFCFHVYRAREKVLTVVGIQLLAGNHIQDMQSKSLKQLNFLHFSGDYIPKENVDHTYGLFNKMENILSLNK